MYLLSQMKLHPMWKLRNASPTFDIEVHHMTMPELHIAASALMLVGSNPPQSGTGNIR